MTRPLCVGVLAEAGALLARYGHLRCVPEVEVTEEDGLVFTLRVPVEGQCCSADACDALALHGELRYLVDVCTLRALAAQYGMDVTALEALLPKVPEEG